MEEDKLCPIVAIIADDLTGALDSSAPFAQKGHSVAVAIRPDHIDAAINSGASVISVNTVSRDLPPAEAAEIVESCAAKLLAAKPSIAFKKIDSRLYGNVREEIDAALRGFNLNHTVVAPAIPQLGRTVVDGHVVGSGVTQRISVNETLAGLRGRYELPDTVDAKTLDRVAKRIVDETGILATGALGLATAISNILPNGSMPAAKLKVNKPILFAIGSRDQATYDSLGVLLEEFPETEVSSAPNGLLQPLSRSADIGVLLITQSRATESKLTVSNRFAVGVRDQIMNSNPKTLFLAGGDTALSVLQAMGTEVVYPCGVVSAMPWFRVSGTFGQEITIFTKSGGLGYPGTLASIVTL